MEHLTMKKLIALALAAGFSIAANAANETYVIDNTHSFSRFEYSHFGYSNQLSRFDSTSGKIQIDRAAKTGSVDVTIDAKSVSTGSQVFNGHIQGEDFLDTAKYPTITYKSTKFNFNGDKLASVEGNLTIKGVTKPVKLEVTSFQCMAHPILKKDACGANAVATIKRSDFNAGKYAPYVADELSLTFAIESIKE
jgi:polyisoprenoid-binding protein YceI